jgi:hypothetical protein
MGLSVQLGPIPKWQFTDTNVLPLVYGKIYTYFDDQRDVSKPTYQDPAGLIPRTNPIKLDGTGAVGPIYWLTDGNYYVVITDSNNKTIYTIESYHPDSGSNNPVSVSVNLDNCFINPQFVIHQQEYFTEDNIVVGNNAIAANWIMRFNNRTAIDRINFIKVLPGSLPSIIEGDPPYYFNYECTGVGTNETQKDLGQFFTGAETFSNQEITVAFVGASSTSSTVEIFAEVNYGTGGSPIDTYEIGSIQLTTAFTKYFLTTYTLPSLTGKTIGTNPYIFVFVRMPLNAITNVSLTNLQLNVTNRQLPFTYLTQQENNGKTIGSVMPQFNMDSSVDGGFVYTRPDALSIQNGANPYSPILLPPVPIGSGMMWFTENVPDGWLAMYGQSLIKKDYLRLFAVVGTRWGNNKNNDSGTVVSVTNNIVRFENSSAGIITEAWNAGTTGFTISVVQAGTHLLSNIVDISCVAASSLIGGESLTFSMQNGNKWTLWLAINGNGKRPTTAGRIIPQTPIYLNSTDDANTVAAKFADAINPLVFDMMETRGYFPRSKDGSFTSSGYIAGSNTGRDPDVATRTALAGGASGAGVVGTTQSYEIQSHRHSVTTYFKLTSKGAANDYAWIDTSTGNTDYTGGDETRPVNYDFVTIIKY